MPSSIYKAQSYKIISQSLSFGFLTFAQLNFFTMIPRKTTIIFALINLIMLSLFIDRRPNHQGLSRTLPVVSIIEERTLSIDRYHKLTNDKCFCNGHYYSDKAPLPTFLILPGYALLDFTGVVSLDPKTHSLYNSPLLEMVGAIIIGIIPSLILLQLLFNYALREFSFQASKAAAIVMGFFYGSFLFLQAGTLFAHLIATLLMVSGLILYKRNRFFLSGLFIGLAILSEYPIGFFLLILILLHIQNKRKFKELLVVGYGLIPALLAQVIYNQMITGSPFEMPYQNVMADYSQMKQHFGFTWPTWKAFIGLTVSPFRGLLFYAPATIVFILLYTFNTPKQILRNTLLNPFLIVPLLYIILMSGYFSWWGGWCYGPRHLSSAYTILALGSIVAIKEKTYLYPLFRILSLFGLILGLMALNTYWQGLATHYPNPFFQRIIPALEANLSEPLRTQTIESLIKSAIIFLLFLLSPTILKWFGADKRKEAATKMEATSSHNKQ